MHGYHNRIALVDLTRATVDVFHPDDDLLRAYIGGRGLAAAFLDNHGPGLEPLEPSSPLCVLAGPLTGHQLPAREPPGIRVPLTADADDRVGDDRRLHRDRVEEGRPGRADHRRACDHAGVPRRRRPQGHPAGRRRPVGTGAVAAVEALQNTHDEAHVLSIGPAGERLSPIATVINDKGRASGVRHGVGAVLGSKRLKAIVVRRSHAPRREPADPLAYRALLARLHHTLRNSPLLNSKTGALAVHGTPIAVEALGHTEALPTRNYRHTRLDAYRSIGGRTMTDTILRDRQTCSFCPVRCRREVGSDGRYRYVTEGPDYAQLSSLGSNCHLLDLEALGYLNYRCYELGLDPIEMGNTLAMLADATEHGQVPDGLAWGDADRMIELVELTGTGRGLGRILSTGAQHAAATLDVPELAMTVKGISIQNVDPRPEPAWGLLNATEPFGGAAHIWTYGDLVVGMADAAVEPLLTRTSTPRQIAAAVCHRQDLVAVLDSLTSCAFSSYAFSPADYADALTCVTGEVVTATDLLAAGGRIFALERSYNRSNGFTDADDTLPRRFTHEPVPDGVHAGKVCDLPPLLAEYRTLRAPRHDSDPGPTTALPDVA